jgi:hypothetical protein
MFSIICWGAPPLEIYGQPPYTGNILTTGNSFSRLKIPKARKKYIFARFFISAFEISISASFAD